MYKCPNCGSPLTEANASSCPKCNADLSSTAGWKPVAAGIESTEEMPRSLRALGLFFGVALLLSGAWSFYKGVTHPYNPGPQVVFGILSGVDYIPRTVTG
jgi:hypothetical protein